MQPLEIRQPHIVVVGQPFIRESQLRAKIKPLGLKIEYREIDGTLRDLPSADYTILHKPAEHIKRLAAKSSGHIVYVNHGGVQALAKAVEDIRDTLPATPPQVQPHHPSFAPDRLPPVALPPPAIAPPAIVERHKEEPAVIIIPSNVIQDAPSKALCPVCDHPFASEAMMQIHMKSRHPQSYVKLFPPSIKEPSMANKVKCEYCDKMLVDRPQAVSIHNKAYHPEHYMPKATHPAKTEKESPKLVEGRAVLPAVELPLKFCPKCGAQGPHKEYCTDCGLRTGAISRAIETMVKKEYMKW